MEWDEHLKTCEWPFVHEGMSFEEYVKEMKYFQSNHEAYRRGDYVPLWKQASSPELHDSNMIHSTSKIIGEAGAAQQPRCKNV